MYGLQKAAPSETTRREKSRGRATKTATERGFRSGGSPSIIRRKTANRGKIGKGKAGAALVQRGEPSAYSRFLFCFNSQEAEEQRQKEMERLEEERKKEEANQAAVRELERKTKERLRAQREKRIEAQKRRQAE